MIKKRLIGVINVLDGYGVQSFSYSRYLPLGRPEILAENLDRWQVDEILIQCIDRTKNNLGPDFKTLERISKLGLKTPLIFSGGIRSISDGVELIRCGADRLAIDTALRGKKSILMGLSSTLGAQALIASLPVSIHGGKLFWYDYLNKISVPLDESMLEIFNGTILSEALLIDWKHEGFFNRFDINLLNYLEKIKIPCLLFGGISSSGVVKKVLTTPNVAAVAIGNSLNYKEHSIDILRSQVDGVNLRNPLFNYEGF
jgi:cyclase